MNQLIKLTIAILFVLITGIGTAQSREILFTASPSAELTALAEKIKNLDTPKIPDAELTRNSVFFVRIAPPQEHSYG